MAKRKRSLSSREQKDKDKRRKRLKRNELKPSLVYSPVNGPWRLKTAEYFKLDNISCPSDSEETSTELGYPSLLHETNPDGNCFFSALSYIITGTEEYHSQIRSHICNHLLTHQEELTNALPNKYCENAEAYLSNTSMRCERIWATETEIFAAADMLKVDIYVYSKYGPHWKWMKHSPTQSDVTGGIYLYHRNLNHYDVVLSVQNENPKALKKKEMYAKNKEKYRKQENLKYTTDQELQRRKKAASKQKYEKDIQYQQRKKAASKQKYEKDSRYQQRKKAASKKKYREDAIFQERKKRNFRKKYKEDRMFQQCKNAASKQKYKEDKNFQQRRKAASRKKYKENKVFREQVKLASRKKYSENLNFKNRVLYYSLRKYRSNTIFRQNVKASSIKRYASNSLFRHKLKRLLFQQYHKDPTIQVKKKEAVNQRRKNLHVALQTFTKNIKKIPTYPCTVCARTLYKSQVKICNRSKYVNGKFSSNATRCLSGQYTYDSKEWICITCDRHLCAGNMPPQALVNGLQLTIVPEELKHLNHLERQLVALRIPFMKLLSLPKGGQKGVKGQVVNVPSNISSITTSLPRTINEAQMVKVKLKRKLSYKGHYQYEWVRPEKVKEAIEFLKRNNPWYSNIALSDSWFDPETDSDLVKVDEQENSSDEENESSEQENLTMHTQPVETCSQPVDLGQEYLDTENKVFCIAPGENQTPQSIFQEKGADAMAFPNLYPDGKFGYFEDRPIKLSPTKYFNARLFCADKRFARDNQFIFFAQFMIEMSNIRSNISIALRKGKGNTNDGGKVTASMLTNANDLQKILKSDAGFRFLQPVRGSPPYWQRTMKDLYAMIRQLGIPTWFITFSAGETRWDETINALKDPEDPRSPGDIEWTEKCHLIRENPVMCARLFNNRVQRLFTDLIMSPSQPVGDVVDFFYRTEFQQRGSPHIHCLLWVRNAPKLNENTEKEICTFVDKYVSCSMPNEKSDPELHDIVNAVQVHSKTHTKSCKKNSTTCRFNFPRPPIRKTFLVKVTEEDNENKEREKNQTTNMPTLQEIEHLCKSGAERSPKQIVKDIWRIINSTESNLTFDDILLACNITYAKFKESLSANTKKNTIYYKRNVEDGWVNNYNPTLLRAWNANMDIQYVMDPYSCVAYILSYISKAEAEVGELIGNAQKEAREGNKDAATAMKHIAQVYVQNREVSAQEAVFRVCSMHLKECSREVVFIPTGSNAIKMSLPLNILKSRKGNSENIWMSSIIDKYYARPIGQPFDEQCLAEFCSYYSLYPASRPPTSSKKGAQLLHYELNNGLGYIKERKKGKQAVIRYPRFNRLKQENDYFLTLLQLYLPHRTVIIKPEEFFNFEHYIFNGKIGKRSVLNIINENRARFERDADNLEKAWDDVQEGRIGEDAWAAVAPECEAERLTLQEKNTSKVNNEDEDISPDIELLAISKKSSTSTQAGIIQYQKPKISPTKIQDSLRKMNLIQQQVFYKVREWVFEVAWKKSPDPFHLFLTGGAGTGKSHLIKCIYHETNRILSKTLETPDALSVLITAPTGTAAFNIGGMTLHSAFGISKNIKLPYTPLGENILNSLRAKYEHLKLLIIDEISMVDHKLLTYIHGRLTQIKQSKKVFGNVAILAVGDFYQLPPVKASPLYKLKDSIILDLWNPLFQIASLSEIMRQKEDVKFAEMLNRLRVRLRGEPLQQTDLQLLQSVSKESIPIESKNALHIFSTNNEVDAHNEQMVETVCSPCLYSTAKDYTKSTSGTLLLRKLPYSSSSPENLPDIIKLGINARVMLTRNIDTEDGLVNGAFGTISAIEVRGNDIDAVYIQFDNENIGRKAISTTVSNVQGSEKAVRITPYEDVLVGRNALRKQLPLKLGWAATIHKVQGMTTTQVVVSLQKIFQPGMAYVALSRTTTLQGLNILHFDTDCIFASAEIKESLSSMPNYLLQTGVDDKCYCLKLLLHNTEGLLSHRKDIENAGFVNDSQVICFTETWLTKKDYVPPSLIPNSDVHAVYREDAYTSSDPIFRQLKSQAKGGVAIFTKDVKHSRYTTKVKDLECVSIQILEPTAVAVFVIYRPPIYPMDKFKAKISSLLSQINQEISSPVLILGDFNDNYFGKPSLKTLFTSYGYQQLVNKPTTESGSCLDLVLAKDFPEDPNVTIEHLYYSFHDAISIKL
ncbi:uncharacterized protein LOC134261943 [Saccostrea cucullata]|uniref:uncharacterized protein LOC134261943 n=1 Tax=Saccostrea cuccullata TaxID=36930 RepID=UPI002ED2E8B4